MSAELITSTLVWFGVGWLLDRVLGTMPWFMFAGALLGNWTGLYLLWLRGQRSEEGEHASASGSTRAIVPAGGALAPPRAAGATSVTSTPASHRRTTEVPHDAGAAARPGATAPPPREPHTTAKDSAHDDD